jgi:hypothetical protein
MAFRHLKALWDAASAPAPAPIVNTVAADQSPVEMKDFIGPHAYAEAVLHNKWYLYQIDSGACLKVVTRSEKGLLRHKRNIHLACHIVRVMRLLFRFADPIDITWYPTKLKKHMPDDEAVPFGPDHVNSGYTQFRPSKHIIIYRQEEALKVLTHELIHYMGADVAVFPWENALELDARIAREFNVVSLNRRIGSGEAVCDLLAIWLWAAWCACVKDGGERMWADLMTVHTQFAVDKARDIIKRNKYAFPRDAGSGPMFTENTHVFAYYILKAAMMCDTALVQDIYTHALAGQQIHGLGDRMIGALKSEKWLRLRHFRADTHFSLPKKALRMTAPIDP